MDEIEIELEEWTDILLMLRELDEEQRIEFMIRLRTAAIDEPDQTLVNMIDELLKEKDYHKNI
jgi:hypothetical protein